MTQMGARKKAVLIDRKQPAPKLLLLFIESAALVGDLQRSLVEICYSQSPSSTMTKSMHQIQKTFEEHIELKTQYEEASQLRAQMDEELSKTKEQKALVDLRKRRSDFALMRKAKDPELPAEIEIKKQIAQLEAALFNMDAYKTWKEYELQCNELGKKMALCDDSLNEQYSQILFGKKINKDDIPTEISKEIQDFFKSIGIDIIIYSAPAVVYTKPVFREVCELKDADILWGKVKALPDNTHYPCIVIGGGHGEGKKFMSGFDKQSIVKMVGEFTKKKIQTDLICLGSCQGISFSPDVTKLLAKDLGAVVSYVENCSDAFLYSAIQYVLGKAPTLIAQGGMATRNELPAIHLKNGDKFELEEFNSDHFIIEGSPAETQLKIAKLNDVIAQALPPVSSTSLLEIPVMPLEQSELSVRQTSKQDSDSLQNKLANRTTPKIY